MSMTGALATSAPVFDLHTENAHPSGLAFTPRGKGSLYVGNAEPGNHATANERVYRYSTGGLLLNEYRPVNPLPLSRGTRGKIVSMTECGGYLAVVWNRAAPHPTYPNTRQNEAAITWMPLNAEGQAQSIGVQTTHLFTNDVSTGGAATTVCMAPFTGSFGAAANARRPFFVIVRGNNLWVYSMNYSPTGVRNNDPRLNVRGQGSSGNYGPTGRYARMRPNGRSDPSRNIRGTGAYEFLGMAQIYAPVSRDFNAVITGQAGFFTVSPNAALTDCDVNSQASLTDDFTAAMASSTKGMAGDPATRRAFTVHSDGVVRTTIIGRPIQ